MLYLAEQVDVELPLPGEGAEPRAKHSTVCRLLHRALLSKAAAPGQLLDIINTPLGTGPSCTFPGLPKQQEKAFCICCIIVYNNRVTSFSNSKESLRVVWGSNINTLYEAAGTLFSKSKERKYILIPENEEYLLMLSMFA